MRSPKSLLLAAILALLTAVPAQADEASKQAKIEELFSAMQMERMVPQMMQQMTAQMRQMMAGQLQKTNMSPGAATKFEEVQSKMAALISDRMTWQKVKPMYLKVYADTFTEEEVGGITIFYKSPAGQAFLKKTPLLTQNLMQSMQGMMGDLMSEIPRLVQDTSKQDKPKP